MKAETWYVCETCGDRYKTEEKANECESSHFSEVKDVKLVFSSKAKNPEGILVTVVLPNTEIEKVMHFKAVL